MDQKEKKAFSLAARYQSFKHASRGICVFVKNTHNAWIELVALVVAITLGFLLSISMDSWLALVISFGMLLMAEGFNTAIEVHMNLTSPGPHPAARDTKDMAAGAVFIAAIATVILLCIVFIPKLADLYSPHVYSAPMLG